MYVKSLLLTLFLLFSYPNLASDLPVEAFAALPDVRAVSLSPDGKHLASLVRVDLPSVSGTAVNVFDIDSGEKSFPLLAKNETYSIRWMAWANNEILLVSTSKPTDINYYGKNEVRVSKLLTINIRSEKIKNALPKGLLRKFRKHRFVLQEDDVIDLLPDDDKRIMMQVAGQIYKVNLYNKKLEKVGKPQNTLGGWTTDRQGNLRVAREWESDRDRLHIHVCDTQRNCHEMWEFSDDDIDTTWPIGFDADPNILYYRAYHEGMYAVFKLDLGATDKRGELVYADPNGDVYGRLIYSRKTNQVIGITDGINMPYTFWHEDYVALQNGINKALPNTNNYIYSFSEDENRYVVLATSDTNSGTYYLGDRKKKSLDKIAYQYKHLTPDVLAERKAYWYKTRDGLDIEGYLTLPRGVEAKQLPTLIFPHGGPQSHETEGFDYWAQFFADRGYAVLQMNFRGSTGKGLAFKKAGLQEWGKAVQDDIQDGALDLVKKGIADSQRIGIIGASYGGYAALMGAVRTPDFYRCAASFAGVSDARRLAHRSRYWEDRIAKSGRELVSVSPLHQADKIKIPVLLIHGDQDRVVPVRHSRKMYAKLQKQNADVKYLELAGETHYLRNNDHRIATFKALEAFFAENLKPQPSKQQNIANK